MPVSRAVTVRANWRVIFRFEDGHSADVHYLDYHWKGPAMLMHTRPIPASSSGASVSNPWA